MYVYIKENSSKIPVKIISSNIQYDELPPLEFLCILLIVYKQKTQ